MSSRISSAALLLLAGCGKAPADTVPVDRMEAEQRAPDSGRVPCARGGGPLVRDCTIDRERRDGGLMLTVHRPDGGFRRLLVTGDGRGVVAADGAERARVEVVDADRIDVTLGADRYRLPATVRSGR